MSKIEPAVLLAALETRRAHLGSLRVNEQGVGNPSPLTWVEVAAQTGTFSSLFTRLKDGRMPSSENLGRLLSWIGVTEEDLSGDIEEDLDDLVSDALAADEPCTECDQEAAATDAEDGPVEEEPVEEKPDAEVDNRTAAINGTGSLSDSQDPETQAAVGRVAELLREGAVAVSIRHDMDPDTMPDEAEVQAAQEAEDWDRLEELFADVKARPRHVAIVDVAAFSDARLTLGEDGLSISGPVTYEGIWTGDMRRLPYGYLVWTDDLLPIPVIWDRENNDHDGTVVGYISSLERVDGEVSAARPVEASEESVKAVAAAAGTSLDALPAEYFGKWKADGARPVKISAPDSRGLRHFTGHVVPKGVCHRSDMGACFQFPGDVTGDMPGFHTGFEVTLSDGSSLRPGAITFGGMHIDTNLAKNGVDWRSVNRHREDTNQVFALVRVWADAFGLAASGVVMPDVSEAQLLRAQASAPSVELWPAGRGRTLVGVHIVPTPAWPVAASAGSVMEFSSGTDIELEDAPKEDTPESNEGLEDLREALSRIEVALAMLISNIEINEPGADPEPTE